MALTELVLRPAITAVYPTGVGNSATLVGTTSAFADDTDATYVNYPNFGQPVDVQFPAADIPDDAVIPADNAEDPGAAGVEFYLTFRMNNLAPSSGAPTEGAYLNSAFYLTDPDMSLNVGGVAAALGYTPVYAGTGWQYREDMGSAGHKYRAPQGGTLYNWLKLGVLDRTNPGGGTSHAQISEIALVIRYETAPPAPAYVPPVRSTPSLRMLQRGGQGGMSGIPRMIGNPVRGLRQGPGSVY